MDSLTGEVAIRLACGLDETGRTEKSSIDVGMAADMNVAMSMPIC